MMMSVFNFRLKSLLKCKHYPLNANFASVLREDPGSRHAGSVLSFLRLWSGFEDGPLHIDPLWRLFVIP